MAARILAARRIIAYLPNLNAAVRHFTSFNFVESFHQSQLPPPSSSQILTNKTTVLPPVKLNSNDIYPYKGDINLALHNVNDVESVLDQFNEVQITKKDDPVLEFKPSALDNLECSAVECDQNMKKDFQDLFVDRDLSSDHLSVLTLSQKTVNDMSAWSPAVEEEREQILVKFIEGATEICEVLKRAGYWADFIEPESGRPYLGGYTGATLFETDHRYKKLGFRINDLGCCKVIVHSAWGVFVYVGSLFTNAPIDHPVITKLTQYGGEAK